MARKPTYKKRQARKRYNNKKRGRKNARPNKTVSRTVAIPDRAFVKLKFADQYTVSTAGNRVQYSGSNPADPTFLADHTNPANMWTTYAGLYQQYICRGAKFKVRVVAGNEIPTSFIWGCSNSSITGIDDKILLRQPYQYQKLIGKSTGEGVVHGSMYMTARKMSGYEYLDISDWGAFTGVADPPPFKQWVFGIQLNPLDNSSSLSHYVFVDITYYVEFFSRTFVDDMP